MKEAIKKLKRLKAKRVFLQFPEGLKLRIQKIVKELEKEGFEIITCIEPTYGACDVREYEAKLLGCDGILHIGHERLFKTKLPVVYWEYFIEADPTPTLEKEFGKLKDYRKIGLITSIQFVKSIPLVKEYLEKKGKIVFVGKALQYPGQVLGCRLEAAEKIENKVDCFLCISAGKFYSSGATIWLNKPVLCLDLEKGEIYDLNSFRDKILKILTWYKVEFKEATNIGILVSWKKGQLKNSFELKKKLEKLGKNIYILAMDEITPDKLEGLKLDLCINMACPRIGLDDLNRYNIPILNFDQLEV